MFPSFTKIYFDGCSVGADDEGTEFLLAVGGTLLRSGGGVVSGYTSPGYGLNGWAPFYAGHTIHVSGSLKVLYFGPGGRLVDPPD